MTAVRFPVRVQAGARREAVGGSRENGYGTALRVAVSARAIDGRANEAVRRVLADAFGVRRPHVRLLAGSYARDKLVEIDPAPPEAAARLDELLHG